MERANFLNFIQQKNSNLDLKKLSVQSISATISQKCNLNILQFDSPIVSSQMPAFINRKVKNLKPYTNHFKRFNIQTTKIPRTSEQKVEINKVITNDSHKTTNIKYDYLKQLGFPNDVKFLQSNRIPQISVYHQFLEKTHNSFSNIIENFHKVNKKNSLNLKQDYQRQLRNNNLKQIQKASLTKQRRSLGSQVKDQRLKNTQEAKSEAGKRSTNNFIKTNEVFIKSQKVCIIPHFSTIEKNKNVEKTIIRTGDEALFSAKYHKKDKQDRNGVTTNFQQRQISSQGNQLTSDRKIIINPSKKDKQLVRFFKSDEKIPIEQAKIGKLQQNIPETISNINEFIKSDIRIKLSPQKNNLKSINNSNIKNQKYSLSSPFKKFPKQEKQRKSKKKVQISAQTDNAYPLPTSITAYSFIVFQPSFSHNNKLKLNQENLRNTNKIFNNSRILASQNCKTAVQIASLTKIMTFLLSIEICDKFKLNSQTQKVRIGKFQSNINGTSAQINQGQFYTVQQLYYGLMLPSGNDASLALAIWGGKKLLINQIKEKQLLKKKNSSQLSHLKATSQLQINEVFCKIGEKKITLKKKKCYERFILQMNKKARILGMTKTSYANSHGLSNNLNKSCAFDLCILCEYAMQNQKFKKVVSTTNYSCEIKYQIISQVQSQQNQPQRRHMRQDQQQNQMNQKNIDDIQHENLHCDQQSVEDLSQKQITNQILTKNTEKQLKQTAQTRVQKSYGQRLVKWQNTHKLLQKQQYIGIKTGITNTAGPCLASCIKTIQNRYFIIIVLNAKKLNNRFKDTEILRKWLFKKQKITKHKPSVLNNYSSSQNKNLQNNFQICTNMPDDQQQTINQNQHDNNLQEDQ